MTNAIIKVENLSKRYHLGELHQRTNSFRDRITSLLKRDGRIKTVETIWALKDVSFEVKKGEILGIIGRNGAGKSTLLKILSRITKPTKGKALINGRVGSLLEVGTGFHQELTGRENVYLNGAILGMRKAEIDKKFDEIVAFSEVDKFIDTPVKRYSSGMYVRLAFSVAAHLEPEILLVDEVLAVGDAQFQEKCLGKMGDVSEEGRTILFVSHNMKAIEHLCPRVILLENGSVSLVGNSNLVVDHYLGRDMGIESKGERRWDNVLPAPGDDVVRLRAVRLVAKDGKSIRSVLTDQEFGIQIEFSTLTNGHKFNVGIYLFNEKNIQIFTSIDNNASWHDSRRPVGTSKSTCHIPSNLLGPGMFSITAQIKRIKPKPARLHFRVPMALIFKVNDSGKTQGDIYHEFVGAIRPTLEWIRMHNPKVECE